MRITLSLVLLSLFCLADLAAQEPSIHQRESEFYGQYKASAEREWDSIMQSSSFAFTLSPSGLRRSTVSAQRPEPCRRTHVVFGWNPYWRGMDYENFDFSLLSDISYFSYEVNPSTGNYTTIHSWETTNLIPMAKEAGTRVNLCVTLFSGHTTFFGNPDAQRTLIDSLIALVKRRDADGVNIDFEALPAGQRANMTAFMRDLGTRFHVEVPGSQISIDIPAVDWNNSFDVAAMLPYVDLFIIMGYDFHWRNAPNTGPVAPKNNGDFWSPYDVTRSVRSYLEKNVPPEKLCLGIPWYGYDWPSANELPAAQTQGAGNAWPYGNVREEILQSGNTRQWDRHSSTPWFAYRDGAGMWRQTWYEDAESLKMKYDMLKMEKLAGAAIWALGYDGGYPDMWDALREKFTDCGRAPCRGTISDMGGPEGNYFPNDEWSYTIAPEGATSVTLSFDAFLYDLADDHLYVYEGPNATGTPIADLTGTDRPAAITAQREAMTLRFISDGDLEGEGFEANWSCSTIPLSVEEAPARDFSFSVSIRPNPSAGNGVLSVEIPERATITATLFDLTGRETGQMKRMLSAGRTDLVLNKLFADLPLGTYLLRVESEGKVRVVEVHLNGEG